MAVSAPAPGRGRRAKAAARDPSVDAATLLSGIRVGRDYEALAAADLVIEAVPEAFAMKVEALSAAEAGRRRIRVARDQHLVTVGHAGWPTSFGRPERFCGLHFFNPVPPSALVEIVLTTRTSPELRQHGREVG